MWSELLAATMLIEHGDQFVLSWNWDHLIVWAGRPILRWQKHSHEFSDEFVGRHSGQTAFQKPSCNMIVGGNACKIEIRRVVGLERSEDFVAAPKNVETTGLPGAQTQAAQIANPPGRTVDEAPANRAKARAYDPARLAGD